MRVLAIVLALTLLACGPSRRHRGGDGDGDGDADADGDGPPCDRDADGHEAVDCGGDDCDDAAAGTHPGAPDAPWSIERLGMSGEIVSFAIAPDGSRHLVLGQGLLGIAYATDRSGAWVTETLEAGRYQGRQTGLVLDAAGAAHVAWVRETPREVRYATNATGAWTIEPVDGSLLADAPCLAIDAAGVAHVAYTGADSYEVRVATREGGAWRVEPLAGMRAIGLAMALDTEGATHLVFANPGQGGGAPTHATNASGAWTQQAVGAGYPSGVGSLPSIAIGPDGAIHVAWFVLDGGLLQYASDATGAFVEETVTVVGTYGGSPSVAVDAGGRVHLAATASDDWTVSALLHAVRSDGSWNAGTIASGRGMVIELDADGNAAILHTTADLDLAIAHHGFADGIDQDCDGTADRHSGLPDADAPSGLAEPEAQALCGWALDLSGGAGARHECAGSAVTVGTVDECVATRGMCPTVAAFEECMLAMAADPCALTAGLPPSCAACTSGVDPARTLAELTAPEWQAWCGWSISTQGGEGKVTTCDDGSVTVRTVDDCVSGAAAFGSCAVTVAEADACTIAMAEDACTGMEAPACAALLACLMGGF